MIEIGDRRHDHLPSYQYQYQKRLTIDGKTEEATDDKDISSEDEAKERFLKNRDEDASIQSAGHVTV